MGVTPLPPLPRTVILDYYDSYTNNLLTLFTKLYSDEEVLKKVVVVKADRYTWTEFQEQVLPNIDSVILSPGPGRPDNASDIGFALDLLRAHPVPILGVCLGHQAIGVAFGGKIINTPKITHGHVVPVQPVHPYSGLFASPTWEKTTKEGDIFDVVVYNSLTVDPDSLPKDLEVTAWSAGESIKTIQGLRHGQHPIWGVQYHPESISSTRGAALLQSFLAEVHIHHSQPDTYPALPPHVLESCAYRVISGGSSKRKTKQKSRTQDVRETAWPTPPITPSGSQVSDEDDTQSSLVVAGSSSGRSTPRNETGRYRIREHRFGDVGKDARTQDVFEAVVKGKGKQRESVGEVWLDGETPTRPKTTSLASPSFVITYTLASRCVYLHIANQPVQHLYLDDETFWNWFSEAQNYLTSQLSTSTKSGWKGGWVGWFGYEMKEESLAGYRRKAVSASAEDVGEVDACWAWCDQLVQRLPDGEWITRVVTETDLPGDENSKPPMIQWLESHGVVFGISPEQYQQHLDDTLATLKAPTKSSISPVRSFPIFRPISSGDTYRSRIDQCREAIRQGESYELTLTTRFGSHLNDSQDPYELYLRLRAFNPAYYSTYLSFPGIKTPRGKGIHILSSSPERFLKIQERMVEMMPIKGTRARVKVGQQCVCIPGRGCEGKDVGGLECIEEAKREDIRIGEELRKDPKERAENLMIVDLIRSDLLSCCTPSTVTVPKLIALESYGVHNLVTTVRGELASNVGSVEAVKRCFPPGSMTGAPKLRSVQLLEGFEAGQRRGVYSGALGYIGMDGETDLSVVIRTMIVQGRELYIGAGGAITWLSDRDGEWDEVLTKVKSVVGVLEGVE